MASISAQITREITSHFNRLQVATEKAEITAVNRAGKSAYSASIKFLSKNYNLAQKDLRNYFRLKKANKGRRVFTVEAERKTLGFYLNSGATRLFKVKQIKKGVKYVVRKGHQKTIEGAFIAQMPSGHKGVFVRKPNKKSKTRTGKKNAVNKHTQAIEEKYALNVGDVWFGKLTRAEMEEKFMERFHIEFEHNLQRNVERIK